MSNTTKTILVTGANGTVGSHVVQALLARGANVRAGVRSRDKGATLAAAGAEVVELDLARPDTLNAAFEGVDGLFLLTPFIPEPLPLVRNALAAATAAGVAHVVRVSSAGADANSPATLARHHGEGEDAVKASGIAWTVLRPTFFQSNPTHFQGDSLRGDGAFYGASGGGRTAYVAVKDIAEVAAVALTSPADHAGQTYTLTGPEALTDSEVAAVIAEAAGRPISYVDLDPETYAGGLASAGAPQFQVDGLVFLEGIKANGWAEAISPDIEHILGRPATRYADDIGSYSASLSVSAA